MLSVKCQHCNGTGEQIDHKQLGSRLRAERELHGMSQAVMAGKLGMTQGFLSDLERGRRNWLGRHIKAYQMALAPGIAASLTTVQDVQEVYRQMKNEPMVAGPEKTVAIGTNATGDVSPDTGRPVEGGESGTGEAKL